MITYLGILFTGLLIGLIVGIIIGLIWKSNKEVKEDKQKAKEVLEK